MKIGIITQPLRNNYGGLLQNYALQQVLKKLGHEVITLDQTNLPVVTQLMLIASFLKTFILKMIGKGTRRKYPVFNNVKKAYISKYSQYFIEKYINRTIPMCRKKDFRNYCISKNLEVLIVGSDQVWRPCFNYNIYRSFFDFADGLKIKRYAYAASFGVDYWEFTEKQTLKCRKLLEMFDETSVREESGVHLCETYLNRKPEYVLDPTMLLYKEDYEELVNMENEPISSGNLFTYILDESEEKTNIIEKVAKSLDLKPFKVMPKYRVNRETIKQIDDCVFPPVTRWLRAFMDAEFVVCDSFHGAVFSIIFNKSFIIIGNKKRGMTRFNSLLKTFDLQERMVNNISDVHSVINTVIDWDKVNKIHCKCRYESINFLKSIQSKTNNNH